MPETLTQLIQNNLLRGIVVLIVLVILTIIVLSLVRTATNTIEKRFIAPTEDLDRKARLQTLLKATRSTVQGIVLVIAVLIGLSTMGVDIGPTLAPGHSWFSCVAWGANAYKRRDWWTNNSAGG
jgi:small-conductance mechanosensitive channel